MNSTCGKFCGSMIPGEMKPLLSEWHGFGAHTTRLTILMSGEDLQ